MDYEKGMVRCGNCGEMIDEIDAYLCDYRIGTVYMCHGDALHSTLDIDEATCSTVLCKQCAIEVQPHKHLCPRHAREIARILSDRLRFVPEMRNVDG